MFRKALALVVIAAGCAAFYQFVWVPHHCNVVSGRAHDALERVWAQRHTRRAQVIAKRNATELVTCLDRQPHNVALAISTAVNLEVAQRFDLAGVIYCDALRFERRPELYVGCGRLKLSQGKRDEALAMFVQAGQFAGVDRMWQIDDPVMRAEAIRKIGEHYERKLTAQGKLDERNSVLNGNFAVPSRRGVSRVEFARVGQILSAAQSWFLLNRTRATAVSELVPSERRRGGTAMHVNVATAGSGLRQVWPRANRRPRVRASAWIRVDRGKVCMGTSNGKELLTNVCSTKTGTWERLEAVNESCPASVTSIFAASDGGAEFTVDEVAARLTYAAEPCGW